MPEKISINLKKIQICSELDLNLIRSINLKVALSS